MTIKPGRSGFLCANADKIGSGIRNKWFLRWLRPAFERPIPKSPKPIQNFLIVPNELLVAMPVLDNEIDPLKEIDVTQHVAFDRNDIGKFSFAH